MEWLDVNVGAGSGNLISCCWLLSESEVLYLRATLTPGFINANGIYNCIRNSLSNTSTVLIPKPTLVFSNVARCTTHSAPSTQHDRAWHLFLN